MSYGNPYSNEGFGEGLERGIGIAVNLRKQEMSEKMQAIEQQNLQQQMSQSSQLFPGKLKEQGLSISGLEASQKHAAALAPYEENLKKIESQYAEPEAQQKIAQGQAQTGLITAQAQAIPSEIGLRQAQAASAYAGADYSKTLAAAAGYDLTNKQHAQQLMETKAAVNLLAPEMKDPDMMRNWQTLDALVNHPNTLPPAMLADPQTHKNILDGTNSVMKPDLETMKGQEVNFTTDPTDPQLSNIPIGSKVVNAQVVNIHPHLKGDGVGLEIDKTVADPAGKTYIVKSYNVVPSAKISSYVDHAGTVAHLIQRFPGGPNKAIEEINGHLDAIAGTNPKYTVNNRYGIFDTLTKQFTETGNQIGAAYVNQMGKLMSNPSLQFTPDRLEQSLKELHAQAIAAGMKPEDVTQIDQAIHSNFTSDGSTANVIDFSQLPSKKK